MSMLASLLCRTDRAPALALRLTTLSALTTILLCLSVFLPTASWGSGLENAADSLVVVKRSIVQDQGGWHVDYRLRYEGPTEVVAHAAAIQAKVESWVSNSRVASHAVPRFSSLSISNESDWSAACEVIGTGDENQRCRERVILQVWAGDQPESNSLSSSGEDKDKDKDDGERNMLITIAKPSGTTERPAQPSLTLTPGAIVRVRLRFEHMHAIHGDYDPLLGERIVELRLGSAILHNVVPMDREQYLALPKSTWQAPPEDRRDTRHSISGPDSLHLEAHIPGNESYKFADRPVRYGTKMRLKYAYLIASGTEGGCRVRISQYRDAPSYKPLYDATQEEFLTKVGRWVKVERTFYTHREATSLALEFRLCDPNETWIGEAWIDDISLEPVLAGSAAP